MYFTFLKSKLFSQDLNLKALLKVLTEVQIQSLVPTFRTFKSITFGLSKVNK